MLECFARLLEDVLPPIKQLQPEIFPLALVHKWLFVAWPIDLAVRSKPRCRAYSRARPIALAVLMGLFRHPAVFALEQLHLCVLPATNSAKRPRAAAYNQALWKRQQHHRATRRAAGPAGVLQRRSPLVRRFSCDL